MDSVFQLPEQHQQPRIDSEETTTHALSQGFSNAVPTNSNSRDKALRGNFNIRNTSSTSTFQRDNPREPALVDEKATTSNPRYHAKRESSASKHDKSSDSTVQFEYHREQSIGNDRVPTSIVQDRLEQDIASNQDKIDEVDPLFDDNKLLQGPRLAQPGDDSSDTIKKVPSDQTLPKFRWGSNHRSTGRAKTGLLIQVPGRDTSIILVEGGPITGNSIMYAYTSSSSSSGRTTNSFGAVGDHLSSTRSKRSSLNILPSVEEDPPTKHYASRFDFQGNRALASAGAKLRSPLAKLLHDSTPDATYPLIAVGEAGPLQQPVIAQAVAPSSLRPLRRRSLSDLTESHPLLTSPIRQETSNSAGGQPTAATAVSRLNGTWIESQIVTTVRPDDNGPSQAAPVWHRAGSPFMPTSSPYLDPDSFTLPYGSKVYIMKSKNLLNLRASVLHGVWSSPSGSSKMLQLNWEQKKAGEKIVLLFSIIKGHKHSSKYCGMAEMSGAYNPDTNPPIWTDDLRGNEGSIPIRWIVSKDVPFSAFDGQERNDLPITQMRHGNMAAGEVGRTLIQTYFEHEHGPTAIIHPDYDLVEEGRPRSIRFRPRADHSRDWNGGRRGCGHRPQQRHERGGSSIAPNSPASFGQTPTLYQPAFANGNQHYRPQFQQFQNEQSQYQSQSYQESPSKRTPPDRGPQHGYDLSVNANVGSPMRQAPNFNQHSFVQGNNGNPHPFQNVQPNIQSPAHGGRYWYGTENITSPPNQAPPGHDHQYGYARRANADAGFPPRQATPGHYAQYGHAARVNTKVASTSAQAPLGHMFQNGHAPPFNPTISPRHAFPFHETRFEGVNPAFQPAVFGPRPSQAAQSINSHFGRVSPARAPLAYGPRGQAPRYNPLEYAPPVHGSHFGQRQSHREAQQASQGPIFELDSRDEPERSSSQRDAPYAWDY